MSGWEMLDDTPPLAGPPPPPPPTQDEWIRALRSYAVRDGRQQAVRLADTALALYERNEKLEAVVKELADTNTIEVDDGDSWCSLCCESEHPPSCPWRMARELVEP